MRTELSNSIFIDLLISACESSLSERECEIFDLRYGLLGGDERTLREAGAEIGVSGERVRQILKKSHIKVRNKGWRELQNGLSESPCARLLSYLDSEIASDDNDIVIEKLVFFIKEQTPFLPLTTHALPLITNLLLNQKYKEFRVSDAIELINKHRDQKLSHERLLKFDQLLDGVTWPERIRKIEDADLVNIKSTRNVSSNGEGVSGSFYSKKMDRNVQYESLLEFDFLAKLEELNSVAFYQEQPFIVRYGENEGKEYYPDVFVMLQGRKGMLVEIKPVFRMALKQNLDKWKALKKFCSKRGLGVLVTDGRCSIKQLMNIDVNKDLQSDVMAIVKSRPMIWNEYAQIKDRHQVKRDEFVALVLQNKLIWKLGPFEVKLNLDK